MLANIGYAVTPSRRPCFQREERGQALRRQGSGEEELILMFHAPSDCVGVRTVVAGTRRGILDSPGRPAARREGA